MFEASDGCGVSGEQRIVTCRKNKYMSRVGNVNLYCEVVLLIKLTY